MFRLDDDLQVTPVLYEIAILAAMIPGVYLLGEWGARRRNRFKQQPKAVATFIEDDDWESIPE